MTELVLVGADDEAALAAEARRVAAFIGRAPEVSLADVAYTCSLRHGATTLAVIASDTASLKTRLESAAARIEGGGARRIRDKSGTYYFRDKLVGEGRGKLAFVYPGVMSFYPDMLRDFAILHPECRAAFDELEEALAGVAGFTPSSFIFPPAPYYRHDADIFKSGAYAQALVSTYAGCTALNSLLAGFGLSPDGVVGFAGGDLAAMMRSGAAGAAPSRPERLRVISDIYGIVYKAVNHGGLPCVAMFTTLSRHPGEAEAVVASFPEGMATLVADFSPRQKTYAIKIDHADEAAAAFAAAGVRAVRLALDRPFSTPMCEKIVPAIKKFVAGWMKHPPAIDVYSCATAGLVPSRLRAAREDTAGRWAQTVRFADTVRQMYADGYRVFLEVGPRGLLTAAIGDTLREEAHAALALDSIHRRGLLQAQHSIGQLAALGADLDISSIFRRRGARRRDFDSAVPLSVRRDSEMRLSRSFPRLTLLSSETLLKEASFAAEPSGRGAKAAARAAAIARQARRQRQFDFGAVNPLVSDADVLESSPGVSVEISKTFRISELPFLGDYALGTSQLSYSDPNLKGLVLLPLSVGVEIMAEAAELVTPNRHLLRIEDASIRRTVHFSGDELKLFVKAERVAAESQGEHAVKVQIRENAKDVAYTWPVMDATFVLSDAAPEARPASVRPLQRPRSVHWSGRDIYPVRVSAGRRLRGIHFAEAWSEGGVDYEVEVPPLAGNVEFTRFPIWVVNPLLLESIVGGFTLWRSHERFAGAFSFPFRVRRLSFLGPAPEEGSHLRCYLRLSGVTPKSQICDISVTDGNGNEVLSVSGWEEQTERTPAEYRQLVLQPATTFLTEPLSPETIGSPATDFATAFVTDVPYDVFERNEGIWLKILSHVVLDAAERREFAEMTGSAARRTEWLFGRMAAKEAVRRFLKTYFQARWSDADIRIWADGSGKPHALGAWSDFLSAKLDIAIAHTSRFVAAVAASSARVGIDVEATDRDLSDEFAAGVFTPDELDLAAQAANASQAIIKFWCAKEALSKALGTGIRYSPKELVVTGFLADSGSVTMRLEGAWAEAFKNLRGRDLHATVATVRGHAIASCFIPASMFDE